MKPVLTPGINTESHFECRRDEPLSLTNAKRNTSISRVFKDSLNTVFKQQMIKAHTSLENVSERMLIYPKNYECKGNEYTYGKKFNCLGFEYAPLTCYYGSLDRVDHIYDIRTWLHYKGYMNEMLSEGFVLFSDFHAQVNRVFNHPYHLIKLYRRFHEDHEFYNELMWLRELNGDAEE